MMPVVILVVLWMSLGTSFLAFMRGCRGSMKLFEMRVDGVRNPGRALLCHSPADEGLPDVPAIAYHELVMAAAQIIPLVGFTLDYSSHM